MPRKPDKQRPAPHAFDDMVIDLFRDHYGEAVDLDTGNQVFFFSVFGDFRGKKRKWNIEVITGHVQASVLHLRQLQHSAESRITGEAGVIIVSRSGIVPSAQRWLDEVANENFMHVTNDELIRELEFTIPDDSAFPEVNHIGHNSDKYKEAIKALDAVNESLRPSNSCELRSDVRDRLLVEIKTGKTLLEATQVRFKAISNSALPALKFIAKTFAATMLGELAKVAFKAVLALFTS